jgi:DNA-binding beta-propeller fold protein YncE
VLRVLFKKGTEPGELAYARAIAAARDGSAYYLVDKMGRLQKLDRDLHVRALVRTPEIARGKPTGLFVAASGEVWVSDTHYARVLVYTKDLVLERAWGAPGDRLGAFLFLRDVKERGDGALIAADYGDETARIQVFRSENEALFQFGKFGSKPGEFQRPMKVAVDLARKELFVADSVNHRIQVLSFEGKPIREFGGIGAEAGRLKYPYDVVLDEEGRVWVAEFGNHRLSVFSREGRPLATWGKAGRGEGELAFPWGLALEPEGRLLLLDSGNDRVYELDRGAVLASGFGS